MNITELAMYKKLFGGGGGKREGTAIPVGQAVDRIYFNTENSQHKTAEILSQLTYVQSIFSEYPISLIYACVDENMMGHMIFAQKTGETTTANVGYTIVYMTDFKGMAGDILFNDVVGEEQSLNNGWHYELEGQYPQWGVLNSTSLTLCNAGTLIPMTDFSGLPIGTENEKIKNVLSITPF